MNINEKVQPWISWAIIIIALVVFPGIGFILLFVKIFKILKKKKILITHGTVEKVIAYVMYGLAVFFLITGIIARYDFWMYLVLSLILGVMGFFTQSEGERIAKERENLRLYVPIIVNQNVYQLDTIAKLAGKPYDVARADIEQLIKSGRLKKAHIDEKTKTVVLQQKNHGLIASVGSVIAQLPNANTSNASSVNVNVSHEKPSAPPIKEEKRICSNCGADFILYGNEGECEYCGTKWTRTKK